MWACPIPVLFDLYPLNIHGQARRTCTVARCVRPCLRMVPTWTLPTTEVPRLCWSAQPAAGAPLLLFHLCSVLFFSDFAFTWKCFVMALYYLASIPLRYFYDVFQSSYHFNITLILHWFFFLLSRIDLIELLVAHGADLHAVDGKNQNAIDVATFYSQEAVVKYLSTQGFK